MNAPVRTVRAYAPASIGNFAAGFDLLGAAVAPLDGSLLGDVVTVQEASEDDFHITGPFAERMYRECGQNLVLRVRDLFREQLEERDLPCPPVVISLEKNLPLSSGLGSSASSIVAALTALQAFSGNLLSRTELLMLAAKAEATYSGGEAILDNVAASLLGGLQMVVLGERLPTVRSLPWPDDLLLVILHPNFELSTAKSREALPASLPVSTAVEFAGNLAAFMHALHTKDRHLLSHCLRDPLAESYRIDLVPQFRFAKGMALSTGALGCTLSGSGPSIFAVADSEKMAVEVKKSLMFMYREIGMETREWICKLDLQGARVLP
jgi:homoserine kinase